MILTNHALTGVLLALTIRQPWLLAPAALASHVILDTLPHFGYSDHHLTSRKWFITGAVDGLVTLGVIMAAWALWPHYLLHISIGVVFAILPDLFYVPETMVRRSITGAWGRFHNFVQWGENPTGWAVDAAWAVVVVCWLSGMLH